MDLSGKSVFLTGATGFIGRHIVRRLLDGGTRVTALIRADSADLPQSVRLVRGRLEDDIEVLAAAMQRHEALIHNAGLITFDPRRVDELHSVNAEGTRRILAAARAAGIHRCVFVSSAGTIGIARHAHQLLDENTPFDDRQAARNPYMASKRAGELHALDAARSGQDVVIVNPTTVLGPGDASLNGGTLFKQVATAHLLPVPTGGTNVVDVDDVAAGVLAALRRGRSCKRYILGAHNLPYADLFARIAETIGRHPIWLPLGPAARGPMKAAAWMLHRLTGNRLITPQVVEDTFAFKYFSTRKATDKLGWRPQRDLRRTLADAWAYYRREDLIPAPRVASHRLEGATV